MKTRVTFPIFRNTSLLLAWIIVLSVCTLCSAGYADACSVMMKSNQQGTFIGRTSDFFGPLQTKLEIIPRGFKEHDSITNFSWKVKYGTVGIIDFNLLYDGINEKGLSAHILLQEDCKLPPLVPNKQTISFSWAKYILTTCADVKEAVANLQNYQVKFDAIVYEGKEVPGMLPHLAVFDPSGDAAIIEFNDGKVQVFHGPQYNVMTNAPKLPDQLANLEKVRSDKIQFSIAQLPGGADAKARFVRATFNMEKMPEPASATQAVIFMEEAINNIAVPAYDDKTNPDSPFLSDAWETRWRVVYDLKNMHMFFDYDQTGKKVYLKIEDALFEGKTIKYIDPTKTKSPFEL